MLSLAMYSYMALSPTDRAYYDNVIPNHVRFHVSACCRLLVDMAKKGWKGDKKFGLCFVAHEAAHQGHINCLKMAHRCGFKMQDTIVNAAFKYVRNKECVEYILQDEKMARMYLKDYETLGIDGLWKLLKKKKAYEKLIAGRFLFPINEHELPLRKGEELEPYEKLMLGIL